jgi:hypothetical protein
VLPRRLHMLLVLGVHLLEQPAVHHAAGSPQQRNMQALSGN